jgi:ABC-2 type transport system ATP-binding protein
MLTSQVAVPAPPGETPGLNPPPPAVELESLGKRFGGVAAVTDVSLAVRPGEVFGLLGPNGAGKTTILRMACGLLAPSTGRASVAGVDVWRDPLRAKRLLGYLDEEPLLYPNLSGREFLDLVGDLYGVPRGAEREERIARLLAVVELEDKQHQLIAGYSHGMRNKIGLAALLLYEPRVLLLDEPTNGLDPRSARRVRDLLRELAHHGVAVVLSTHILGVAQALCDRVAIVDHGRVVAVGTVDELRARTGSAHASLEDLFLALTGGPEDRALLDRLLSA